MKKICFFLACLLLLTNISSAASAITQEENAKVIDPQNIIAIVDGIELTKDDIDENGFVKDGILPVLDSESSISLRYSTPPTMEVPKGANSLVIKTTAVQGYGQQVDYYYLNKSSANTFAYKLTGSGTTLGELVNYAIGTLIAFKVSNPWIGVLYSGASMLGSLRMNAVRDKILSYNSPVEVRVIKSRYGTYYAVNRWNGTTVNISQGGDTWLKFVKHNY